MQIGNLVRVTSGCDETFDDSYRGLEGVIVALIVEGAGVGETAKDPFIRVSFGAKAPESFWTEELEVRYRPNFV